MIVEGGRVVGYIQSGEETDPDFRHAGIDLFLTTDTQGRGLGPDAIRTLAAHLIDDRGHHRLTIDPGGRQRGAPSRPTPRSASGPSGHAALPAACPTGAGSTGC